MIDTPMTRPVLVFQKLHDDVAVPEYHTEEAAAFDIAPHLIAGTYLEGRDSNNRLTSLQVLHDDDGPGVRLYPRQAVKLPTGLRAQIPSGYNIEMRGRSGALKHPLRLCNGVGTLDGDYQGEWFIGVENISEAPYVVRNVRLVQCLLQKTNRCPIQVLPAGKRLEDYFMATARGAGGFGSTGA